MWHILNSCNSVSAIQSAILFLRRHPYFTVIGKISSMIYAFCSCTPNEVPENPLLSPPKPSRGSQVWYSLRYDRGYKQQNRGATKSTKVIASPFGDGPHVCICRYAHAQWELDFSNDCHLLWGGRTGQDNHATKTIYMYLHMLIPMSILRSRCSWGASFGVQASFLRLFTHPSRNVAPTDSPRECSIWGFWFPPPKAVWTSTGR